MTKQNQLEYIIGSMRERYSARYATMGHDVKTLGWGSQQQQMTRFLQTTAAEIDMSSAEVLDIGCGFGDLYDFYCQHGCEPERYTGWDINHDLIEAAKKYHGDKSSLSFEVRSLLDEEKWLPHADMVVMNGVLNLNFHDQYDNAAYSRMMIERAFACARKVLVVDFLSSCRTPDYPREDFVYYHDPAQMLSFALTLTPNVVLKHNYAPIPQKEFMLFLYREEEI